MNDEGMSNFTPRAQQVLALARKERAALQASESEPAPERELARAALGVDRHPAGIFGGTPSGSVGPVEDLDDFEGFVEEPLPLEPFDPDPSA